MQGFNAPGRFSRTPASLRRAIARETAVPRASFGFVTEVADPDRSAVLGAGAGPDWTVTHRDGRGDGECAILTRDAMREVVHQDWLELTDGGGKSRLANPLVAPVVITRAPSGRITLFTVAHMPAHIETIWRAIPLPTRVKAKALLKRPNLSPVIRTYVEALLAWKHQVMQLAAEYHVDDIVVGADWNLSSFAKWVRVLFDNAWPGLTIATTKGPDLGRRNIGWLLTSMDLVDASVHDTKASDHRVGRFTLRHLNKPHVDPKPADPPPPFELCTYNGARMDQQTKVRVQTLEAGPLKDLAPLTIFQGCYNAGGVAASAGTHDKGGVLDFAPFEYGRKVKAWRTLFGPAWHRVAITGLWGEHIHVVSAHGGNLAPSAQRQVGYYYRGLDGLADMARDPNQYHPEVTFDYASAWREINAA